ncbi:MAG: radical SAM protein [Pseudomonadota bacterium]
MPTLPLGLACVAAATRRAGHDVELVDLMGEKDAGWIIRDAAERLKPNIIGISVRNIDDQNMANPRFLLDQVRDVLTHCRRVSMAPIVLGGAGFSLFPQSVLKYLGADMGIQGEGEYSFPLLIQRIQGGHSLSEVPGLYLLDRGLQGNRQFEKELDQFPLPDLHLLSPSLYEGEDFWVPVQTRRGCPMRCSYCSTETIEGCHIRKRSPEDILRWLHQWVKAGFHRFHFVDNTFNFPPSYARALCSRIIEEGWDAAWRCLLYPGRADEALVKMMARAGCKEVSLGFESGCARILKGMNKRFKKEEIRLTNELLADNGIHRMGFLLLGGPGETKESVEESLSFVDSLALDILKVTIGIRIYPHTKLSRIATEEAVIGKDDDLLFPRFYMVKGLEAWARETIDVWKKDRPNWII